MAQNACAGLCYLAANGIVHRDIAARNLLVKQEDFKYFVKVSDFGLRFKHFFFKTKTLIILINF